MFVIRVTFCGRAKNASRVWEYSFPMVGVQALDMTTIEKFLQPWLPVLLLSSSARCGRPVEEDSVLPAAKVQSPGSADAVKIRFMQGLLHAFGSTGSKEIKGKRRKLWLREHS
jgi:hypothetical protein